MLSNLGNTYSTYKPTSVPTMNITLKPVKQPMGNMHYVAIKDADTSTYDMDNYENIEDDKKKEDRINLLSLGDDNIKVFYIGSVTVVGLFILFRFLTKTK